MKEYNFTLEENGIWSPGISLVEHVDKGYIVPFYQEEDLKYFTRVAISKSIGLSHGRIYAATYWNGGLVARHKCTYQDERILLIRKGLHFKVGKDTPFEMLSHVENESVHDWLLLMWAGSEIVIHQPADVVKKIVP